MRIRETIVAAGMLSITMAALAPREAAAQTTVTPIVQRDENWGVVSNVTMVLGAATVFLMPRVYYNDPEATVGWKGRWHVSVLAPAMTMTALTLMVDTPIKNAIQSTRPGCTVDQTTLAGPGSNCESFGGPSTQAFASWSATGSGLGIFLVDTLKYSQKRFNVGSFIGFVAVPLTLSVITSIARSAEPGTSMGYENAGQIVAGSLTGFGSGLIIGGGYALLQHPSCGYGNAIFCW